MMVVRIVRNFTTLRSLLFTAFELGEDIIHLRADARVTVSGAIQSDQYRRGFQVARFAAFIVPGIAK